MCLDRHKEKFFKTDSYLNSLFDEIADFLNKLVNCVNDLNRIESNSSMVTSDSDSHMYGLTRLDKKSIQDNLNNLNKTVGLARKSMIELVITSTMIGSLKQVREIIDKFESI